MGGGAAASARAAMLQRAGAEVAIVSDFSSALLDGAALVFVAGATLAVNEAVSRAARARSIPVNVMDEPHLSSFLMPAIVERGPVVVAIGTGGAAPFLARLLRQWFDRALPERLGALAALAGRFRPLVKRRLRDAAARRLFWERVFSGEVARHALAGNAAAAGAALLQALDEAREDRAA